MSYKLFLDDVREPKNVKWGDFEDKFFPLTNILVVRNYHDFCKTIMDKGVPEKVSFDHDLADEHYQAYVSGRVLYTGEDKFYDSVKEKTGYHCAQFLFEYCLHHRLKLPEIHVHSMNPVGSEKIKNLFDSYNTTFNAFHG